jgi:hypothetical protein
MDKKELVRRALERERHARERETNALAHQHQAEREAQADADPVLAEMHQIEAAVHARAASLQRSASEVQARHARAHAD